MVKKTSFKKGTEARKARSKVAEDLKAQGKDADYAFAVGTTIVKNAGKAGRKRLAKRGLKKT